MLYKYTLQAQEGLASKSGEPWKSKIAHRYLLKTALVLDCLDDFIYIAKAKEFSFSSLDELLQAKDKPLKKRGKLK